ncbi:TIGR03643 family protein [Salinimonas chungwhensis]|uniref:TIGR03643 family protein n=1 Tax=Salinimonas chungwhensis TaxID=265425 RepID=UPI00035C86AA|nr:TIGR03643 family protein [Salinimonas chungwhensis]
MSSTPDETTLSRIIEMAWEDRTPFDIIEQRFGYGEKDVIALMRRHLKRRAFENWRKRVSGRKTKHAALRPAGITRGYCRSQYKPQGAG